MPVPGFAIKQRLPLRKKRTVLQLHKLWRKSEKRVIDYTMAAKDVLAEITNIIIPNKIGEYTVYASTEKTFFTYVIEHDIRKDSYYFTRTLNYIDSLSRKDFLLLSLDENANILGDKFYLFDRLSMSKLDKTVFYYFWEALKERLEKRRIEFKPETKEGEMLISVTIDNFVYNIGVKYSYGTYWYTWYGEHSNKTLSFNRKTK